MSTQASMMDGEVVVITGAGKGVGRACALHLAACGARVLVNTRSWTERCFSGSSRFVAAQWWQIH